MKIKAQVIAFEAKPSTKTARVYSTLTLLDSDAHPHRMKNTIDYAMSVSDVEKFPDLEALIGQTLEFGITGMRAGFAGREELSGAIISAPKTAKG